MNSLQIAASILSTIIKALSAFDFWEDIDNKSYSRNYFQESTWKEIVEVLIEIKNFENREDQRKFNIGEVEDPYELVRDVKGNSEDSFSNPQRSHLEKVADINEPSFLSSLASESNHKLLLTSLQDDFFGRIGVSSDGLGLFTRLIVTLKKKSSRNFDKVVSSLNTDKKKLIRLVLKSEEYRSKMEIEDSAFLD